MHRAPRGGVVAPHGPCHQRKRRQGQYIRTFGGKGKEAGKVDCPHGACFDHKGNIFVVEWVEVGRVTKLRRV